MAECVASQEELEAFASARPEDRRSTPSLRGVLAETAATGIIRYEWQLLQVLAAFYLDQVLSDYEAESKVEIGPPVPLPGGESPAELRQRLQRLLSENFQYEAPFTMQRLAELLLEPHKHYARLEKLALAVEKLLLVTSTVKPAMSPLPRPRLADLPPVNDNPPNPVASTSSIQDHTATNGLPHPDSGFGLASSALVSSSVDHSDPVVGTEQAPELMEGLGHLNEAGVAAQAAPNSPLREKDPE